MSTPALDAVVNLACVLFYIGFEPTWGTAPLAFSVGWNLGTIVIALIKFNIRMSRYE